MAYPIDPPDMPRELTTNVAEHEIMLSFVNDSDAEMFSDWWNSKGLEAFMKWAEKNADKYQ